jgi:hypothetical protein
MKMQEPQREKRLPAAKRRQLEACQDAHDFAAEYRMLKKVKKGKMSEVHSFPGPITGPPCLPRPVSCNPNDFAAESCVFKRQESFTALRKTQAAVCR